MLYDEYNREERFFCSHLFRLIPEPTQTSIEACWRLTGAGVSSAVGAAGSPVSWSVHCIRTYHR